MQLIHFVIITQERRCIFSLQIVFEEDGRSGETMMIITRFFVVPRLIRREILCHAHLAGKKTNVTQKGGSRNYAFVHVRVCRPMSQYNQRSMMMAADSLDRAGERLLFPRCKLGICPFVCRGRNNSSSTHMSTEMTEGDVSKNVHSVKRRRLSKY